MDASTAVSDAKPLELRSKQDELDKPRQADLDRCVLTDKGALQVDEGWRTMPYLDGGSIGIGLVIDDYLAHRHITRLPALENRTNCREPLVICTSPA